MCEPMLLLILSALVGYLIGCISSGLIISRNAGVDIRSQGSKSTGATNVSRLLGFKLGAATFVGDFLKGILSVFLGTLIAGTHGGIVSGLFSVMGHNWPVFYGFKGGKGIATSCAVLFYLYPVPALIAIALTLTLIAVTRYVSVGSLALLTVTAILVCATKPLWPDGVFTAFLAVVGIYRHKANIVRLIRGNENKFSFKKNA